MYRIFPFLLKKSQPRCDLEATWPCGTGNLQKEALPTDRTHWPVAIVRTLDQNRNDLMRSGAVSKISMPTRVKRTTPFKKGLDIKVGQGKNAKRWKIHRDLVCSQSQYFTTACNSSFREGQDGIFDLPEHNPVPFGLFVSWLYRDLYIYNSDESNDWKRAAEKAWVLGEMLVAPAFQKYVFLQVVVHAGVWEKRG